MSLDKANVTSVITLLFLAVAGYLGLNNILQNYLVSLAGPIAGIIVWYYTEKHNSTLISGTTCTCGLNNETNTIEESEEESEVESNEQ